MAIIFPNQSITQGSNNKISATGHVLQTVQTTYTTSVVVNSLSAVDLFTSTTITLASASNRILIDFYQEVGVQDWGDGVWNLYYLDLVHVQTSTQLTYTGYRGDYTYNRRSYKKSYLHTPGSVGPHSYKLRGWCYSALNVTFGNGYTGGDGIAYIRMMEIAG